MDKLTELIMDQLIDFSWSNYGLDEVGDTFDSSISGRDDWARDLAERIVTSVVNPLLKMTKERAV